MPVTPTTFRAKFLKWSDTTQYPDAYIQGWITTAEGENDATYFGDQYDRAVELYTAHLLQSEEMAQAGRNGPLSSFSVDKESWSFASSGTGLESTTYGEQYQRLCDNCFTGGFTTSTTGRY